MFLLIAIAFLLRHYESQAIPLPAPSPTSAWFEAPIFARDNPSDGCHSRTVLDILWSCLATTFACTWVSVHPNVPFKGEGKWTLLRRRIFLMFFSILAPEFMIVWAFKQWRGAVMIKKTVNDAIKQASLDKEHLVQDPWTTAHGQFMQMGGFRLRTLACENFYVKGSPDLDLRRRKAITALACYENDNIAALCLRDRKRYHELPLGEDDRVAKIISQNKNLIPNNLHYRHETRKGSWVENISEEDAPGIASSDSIWEGVLTIDALRKLLAEKLITLPTITEDEITDKSKGDALSKGIALLQLTWFIVQIITRAVQGLALTELELTTAALAGLNSVMYVFWWSKPRDVRFPVVVLTKGVEALLAQRTEDVMWNFTDSNSGFDFREYLWPSLRTSIKGVLNSLSNFIVSVPMRLLFATLELFNAISVVPHYLYSRFSKGCLNGLNKIGHLKGYKSIGDMNNEDNGDPDNVSQKSPEDANQHRFWMEKLYAALSLGSETATYCFMIIWSLLAYIIFFGVIVPMVQILHSYVNGGGKSRLEAFYTTERVEILYMMFYSEGEGVKPLLATSSIAGALFGAVHCLAWHFTFPTHVEQILWRTASLGIVGSCVVTFLTVLCFDLTKRMGSVLESFILTPCSLATLVYPVARITLLVLAIMSLRSLPPSALDTVNWVEFVPHI